ncbi:hypothetical protein F5146DRAFT_1055068 [Armillaria mellea]|nr:hypothetical protein F5146DRAFT_1055068 [Armillaria mellea]
MLISHSLISVFSVLLIVQGVLSSAVPRMGHAFELPLDDSDSVELVVATCQLENQCTIVDKLGACTVSDVGCICSNDNGKAYAECMTCLVGASKKDIKEGAQSATDLYILSCRMMGVFMEDQDLGLTPVTTPTQDNRLDELGHRLSHVAQSFGIN